MSSHRYQPAGDMTLLLANLAKLYGKVIVQNSQAFSSLLADQPHCHHNSTSHDIYRLHTAAGKAYTFNSSPSHVQSLQYPRRRPDSHSSLCLYISLCPCRIISEQRKTHWTHSDDNMLVKNESGGKYWDLFFSWGISKNA